MILLPLFILLFILYLRKKSVVTFFISIIIVSLIGTSMLGKDSLYIDTKSLFMLTITAIFLILIIVPWKDYVNINQISIQNEHKVNKLTRYLIIINLFIFVILTITTVIVQSTVSDINAFKYVEGTSMEFYYTMLPFDTRYFILATQLYGFAYFLIPLHFLYLSRKKNKLSLICFILSLNIILYGTTYFSRAAVIQYVFLYISMYLILKGSLSKEVNKYIKRGIVILGSVFILYLLSVSIIRFEENYAYETLIPSSAVVQDPVYYSFIDYLSQWYFNGSNVLKDFKNETFNGQITFQSLLSLLSHFGIINYDPLDYQTLRINLWKENHYSFTGFTAYTIYDFGIIFGIVFCIFYYLLVKKNRPINNTIKLNNLFLIVLLVQIPSMSIFYSQVGALLIPFLFYLVIIYYFRIRIR